MIEACVNHKISEGDLLQAFYQGMSYDDKNLLNSSSRGKCDMMRVSEAKNLIQRLVEATCEYEDPQMRRLRMTGDTAALDAKIGKLEKLLTRVAEQVTRPTIVGRETTPPPTASMRSEKRWCKQTPLATGNTEARRETTSQIRTI